MEKKIHATPKDKESQGDVLVTPKTIQSAIEVEKKREEEECKAWFAENFEKMTLLDIYSSELIGEVRKNVVKDLLQAQAEEDVIKSIIRPDFDEGQVLQKKAMWMEMKEK